MKELRPEVRIVGVEPDDSDAMTRSLAAGERVALDHVGRFADGVAVRQVGAHTFELCRRYLDGTLTVTTDEICAAIKDVFEETRTVLEPSGARRARGPEARRRERHASPPGAAVVIASGANMNFTRLGYVTERAEIGEHREAILAVTIPERPGAFLEFCRTIGERSVTEFNYRLAARERGAHLRRARGRGRRRGRGDRRDAAARAATRAPISATTTSPRPTCGTWSAAAAPRCSDEVLYSFEFPERPGALMQFLTSLGSRWNISLFHYRNNGAAFGRVLCGFEVAAGGARRARARRSAQLGFAAATRPTTPPRASSCGERHAHRRQGIALAATLHDPPGALLADVARWLPRCAALRARSRSRAARRPSSRVRALLAAHGVDAGCPASNTRGPLYRLALRRALAGGAARVHYLDFDRALHWIARRPRRARGLARPRATPVIRRCSSAGRRARTRAITRRSSTTESRRRRRASRRGLGLRGRVDFLVPSFVLRREPRPRACSRARAPATRRCTASGWRCFAGLGVPLAYVECDGLDWETPDRHRDEVRRVGRAAWRRAFEHARRNGRCGARWRASSVAASCVRSAARRAGRRSRSAAQRRRHARRRRRGAAASSPTTEPGWRP